MTTPEMNNTQESRTVLPQDIDLDLLLSALVKAGKPVDRYGVDGAKTVGHLLEEVKAGESIISVDTSGNMYREVSVAWVHVLCNLSNGESYILKEDRQEFSNGYVKRRELTSSLGEKLTVGEDPGLATVRALEEELGIDELSIVSIHTLGSHTEAWTPDTYPGLESSYVSHQYATVITEDAFNPDGYKEVQADKTSYFVWEKIYPEIADLH